jgi:hypothetical protein
MKNLNILGGIVLCVISLQLTAQVKAPLNQQLADKPFLFSSLPEKFVISTVAIEKIFAASTARTVRIPINDNQFLEGSIIARTQVGVEVSTVNMLLHNYDQALFTISRIKDKNAVTYIGRIINIRYADVLILRSEDEHLYLVKEKQSLFLVE